MGARIRFGGVAMVAVALALGCQAPGVQTPTPEASGAASGPAASASVAAAASLRFPITLRASEGLVAYAQHQVRVRSLVSGALVPLSSQATGGEVAKGVAVSALVGGKLYLQNPPVGPLMLEFTKSAAPAGRRLQQSEVLNDFFSLLPFGFLSAEEMSALASLPLVSDLSDYLRATGKSPDGPVLPGANIIGPVGPQSSFISSLSPIVFQHSILNGPGLPCSLPGGNQAIANLSFGLDEVGTQMLTFIPNGININILTSTHQLLNGLTKKKANHNKLIGELNANSIISIRNRALAQAPGPCDGGSAQDALARVKAQVKEAGLGEILNDAFFERLNAAFFGPIPEQPWPVVPSVAPAASPSPVPPSPSPMEPQPSPSRNETGTEGTDRPDPVEEA